jgi:glycosyltransferase involved in cell wall biosynthesis
MRYDVVIRCRNEIDWLPRVLSSLNCQSIKPSRIILVENASEDGSKEYALNEDCVVIDYDRSEFNYSYALNLGIKETCEDEILILSAHCELVTAQSVQNMIEVRHVYDAAGVYGRQVPTIRSNPVDTRDLITVFGRERIVFETHPFFPQRVLSDRAFSLGRMPI